MYEAVISLKLTNLQWQEISDELIRLLTVKQVTIKSMMMNRDNPIAMMVNLIVVGGGRGQFYPAPE